MKLLRLKITDPEGFRSLPCSFEHHFRNEWTLQDELARPADFAPFVCAGPNGSGKSNLLEALAAIFYHLECILLGNLPSSFNYDPEENPNGFRGEIGNPDGFEIEYLIRPKHDMKVHGYGQQAHVLISKEPGKFPKWYFLNSTESEGRYEIVAGPAIGQHLMPDYILGYSSGENEILSLPFFKLRFVQFDEYWRALSWQLYYPGHPETRFAYLDNSFSQAILLCNLLFQNEATLEPFRKDIGIEALQEFRIVIRRSISLEPVQLEAFDIGSNDERKERANRLRAEHAKATESELQDFIRRDIVKDNSALCAETDDQGTIRYRVNLMQQLEGDEKSWLAVSALKRCATLSHVDEATDTLILDYWVNDATKAAFRNNFDNSALSLFQAFQVLLTLNLYSVSEQLKTDIYRSNSHYVSETVPTLASDQRIMRFESVKFMKQGVSEPMMLKELSDGEHQLLHSLGLCLLFRDTNSLFLLDEPETHFNPDWRANFISQLRRCLPGNGDVGQEMLITTHTPFLISDSKPDKVLIFKKDKTSGAVSICKPEYNTLGASINKITMSTFGKRETIGGHAQALMEALRARFEHGDENEEELIAEIQRELGDSVEKVLLINAILDRQERKGRAEQG